MTEKSFEQRLAECERVLRKLEGTGKPARANTSTQRNAAVNSEHRRSPEKTRLDRLTFGTKLRYKKLCIAFHYARGKLFSFR
jgi:hypothetical protein